MPIIEVTNLSKRYRIGLKEKRADTFAGQLANVLRAPLDNFRRLRNLSKFGGEDESVFWALRDINFTVEEGEVLGIIGHNGAGKSTLLKILSRITEPTSGQVRLRGRVSSLLEVGTGFHPDLTGRENVYMNGTILGMTRREIDRKFDEIVDFSGVEKYIDTPVKRYSSGMTVRLAFSVAAHLEPEILIIDEVLAVGDAEFQKKCLGKMKDVSGQGRTVLFVSHNMGAVQNLCNRGVMINKGSIIKIGNTQEVVHEYMSHYSEISTFYKHQSEHPIVNLRSVEVITSEGNGLQIVGKPLKIVVDIETERRLNKPALSLMLLNAEGLKILHLLNLSSEVDFAYEKGKFKIECNIPSCSLYPNQYSLNLHFNMGNNLGSIKPLEGICSFEVIKNKERELYWYPNAATFLENHSWKILNYE